MIWPTISKRRNTPTINLTTCISDVLLKKKDYVSDLEEAFAKFYGTKYAFATASGRQAMELALRSFNLKEGDEIIFPTLTFYVLPSIVKELGFIPVFVNCKEDFNIDIEELKTKITPRTKVIIATHIFGKGCQIDSIMKIAHSNEIKVIEDCAHIQGTTYKNKLLGTFGDAAFFSFQNRKPINAFGGGMLITNNKQIHSISKDIISKQNNSRLAIVPRFLLNYFELLMTSRYFYTFPILWWKSKTYGKFVSDIYQKVHHKNVDKRKRFSRLQARIALEQFNAVEKTNEKRFNLAKDYSNNLAGVKDFTLPRISKGDNSFYSLVALSKHADKLGKDLFSKGIDVGTGEIVLRNCGKMYDPKGNYKKTEAILQHLVELPMYQQLSKKDIQKICFTIKEVLK
ncbi:MAG: DegT/DnrJ/EryC1/StrS aminotransferase family protein [archaeon]|jgi:dTDP-4-amino-4,6-dideoxygalactose transaminase